MSPAIIHLPAASWELQRHETSDIVDRLCSAAEAGKPVTVAVVGTGGVLGTLVVSPGAVPVVVTGAVDGPPSESFPVK